MSPSPESSSTSDTPNTNTQSAGGRFRFSKVLSRWWWIATILVVAMTYAVSMIPTWVGMDDPLYESYTLIEVRPIVDIEPTVRGTAGAVPPMTRQFMNTQFEIIAAAATLELALSKSDLLNRLGGDKIAAIKRMKKSIRTTQLSGTDLIRVSYRDENAELAHAAAEAVYQAYKDRRYDLEVNLRKEQLQAIKLDLQHKTERVAELRKRLMEAADKVGLIWVDEVDGGKLQGQRDKQREQHEKELYLAQREQRELTLQINKLLALPDDSSLLLRIELPDVNLKEAYKRYEDAEKELESMKATGLAERHPDIQMRRARLYELKKDLEKRAGNVHETLKHRLDRLAQRVKEIQATVNKNQDEELPKAQRMQELNVARKEYETARSILDRMQMKYDIESTRLRGDPINTIVHEHPEQAGKPITRGREFYVALGTLCSLPFSLGLGILLMYLAELILPPKR